MSEYELQAIWGAEAQVMRPAWVRGTVMEFRPLGVDSVWVVAHPGFDGGVLADLVSEIGGLEWIGTCEDGGLRLRFRAAVEKVERVVGGL